MFVTPLSLSGKTRTGRTRTRGGAVKDPESEPDLSSNVRGKLIIAVIRIKQRYILMLDVLIRYTC